MTRHLTKRRRPHAARQPIGSYQVGGLPVIVSSPATPQPHKRTERVLTDQINPGREMETFKTGTSTMAMASHEDAGEQPFLKLAGVEGSSLRATRSGLTVCPCAGISAPRDAAERHWGYDELTDLRLDVYGSVGVIRATIRSSGALLPLLLLEPDQIAAARRTLEIVWNLMNMKRTQGHPA